MDDIIKNNLIQNQQLEIGNQKTELSRQQAQNWQQGQDLLGAEYANRSLLGQVGELSTQNSRMQSTLREAETAQIVARARLALAEEKNETLRQILSRPLLEIVEENESLREAMVVAKRVRYKEPIKNLLLEHARLKRAETRQNELIEEWSLSERAFVALAYAEAKHLGFDDAAVVEDIAAISAQVSAGLKMKEITSRLLTALGGARLPPEPPTKPSSEQKAAEPEKCTPPKVDVDLNLLEMPLLDLAGDIDQLRTYLEKRQAELEKCMLSQKSHKALYVKLAGDYRMISDETLAAEIDHIKAQIKAGITRDKLTFISY